MLSYCILVLKSYKIKFQNQIQYISCKELQTQISKEVTYFS